MPEPERLSALTGDLFAHLVAKQGGPADPADMGRDIYQETVDATGIDPSAVASYRADRDYLRAHVGEWVEKYQPVDFACEYCGSEADPCDCDPTKEL